MSSKMKVAGASSSKVGQIREQDSPATVPKLRFPEFREAAGWKERPLGDFLSESRLPGSKGNVAKKITVKLWGNGVFEKNDAIQGSINTQYFRRKSGQFIYSKLDFLNQAFGLIPPSLDNFESTVDLPCFDFADGLNPVFLLEYVKRRDFYERLGETADGSRKARRIHAETFLSFPIALPISAEQQKIAECLSSVDELIAAQARKLDALKTHKKGLMQQLFPREGESQPRLRFPEFRNAGEWEEEKLDDLLRFQDGFAFKSTDFVKSKEDTTQVIRITDINNQNTNEDKVYIPSAFIEADKMGKYCVDDGDLLLSLTGAAGFNFFFWDGGPATINQRTAKVTVKKKSNHALLRLLEPLIHEKINARGEGQNNNLSKEFLSSITLVIPEPAEQQRIAACLSSLDDLIAAQTRTLEALKTHKRGLMQGLFPQETGSEKLEVRSEK